MRPTVPFLVSILLFVASEAALVYMGVVKVYFILFIPVFASSSIFSLAPLLFFLIPLVYYFRTLNEYREDQWVSQPPGGDWRGESKKDVKYGGLVMIGPVPILFGKGISNKVLLILAILMILLIIAWFVFAK